MYMYIVCSSDPESTICFGGPFGHFITKYFLGYDMMVIASFKNLLPLIQGMECWLGVYDMPMAAELSFYIKCVPHVLDS